jgi:cytochrome bd-type quinol oxidase subunit 2
METFLFVIFWIGCAALCWVVANGKGRIAGVWFILGLFFGVFALIAVAVMPDIGPNPGDPAPSTHVKCPDCREFVLIDARVCKHCGCRLIPQT